MNIFERYLFRVTLDTYPYYIIKRRGDFYVSNTWSSTITICTVFSSLNVSSLWANEFKNVINQTVIQNIKLCSVSRLRRVETVTLRGKFGRIFQDNVVTHIKRIETLWTTAAVLCKLRDLLRITILYKQPSVAVSDDRSRHRHRLLFRGWPTLYNHAAILLHNRTSTKCTFIT